MSDCGQAARRARHDVALGTDFSEERRRGLACRIQRPGVALLSRCGPSPRSPGSPRGGHRRAWPRGPTTPHRPSRTRSMPSGILLTTAAIRANAVSATVSVRTSGVCPMTIPRRRHAATSMLSTPTAICEITRRLGAAVEQLVVDDIHEHREQPIAVSRPRAGELLSVPGRHLPKSPPGASRAAARGCHRVSDGRRRR